MSFTLKPPEVSAYRVTPQTPFLIGSVTKSFTGRGRVDLDEFGGTALAY